MTDPWQNPPAVEKRLALAVNMLDAAVLELRELMGQLQDSGPDEDPPPIGRTCERDPR